MQSYANRPSVYKKQQPLPWAGGCYRGGGDASRALYCVMIDKIAIIGMGLVGRGWAIVFARAGCEVALYDTASGAAVKARELIIDNLRDLVRHRLIDDADVVLERIAVAEDPAIALDGAVYARRAYLSASTSSARHSRPSTARGSCDDRWQFVFGNSGIGVYGRARMQRSRARRASNQSALSWWHRRTIFCALDLRFHRRGCAHLMERVGRAPVSSVVKSKDFCSTACRACF